MTCLRGFPSVVARFDVSSHVMWPEVLDGIGDGRKFVSTGWLVFASAVLRMDTAWQLSFNLRIPDPLCATGNLELRAWTSCGGKNDWACARFGSAAISQLAGDPGGTDNVMCSPGSMLVHLAPLTSLCLVSGSSMAPIVGATD